MLFLNYNLQVGIVGMQTRWKCCVEQIVFFSISIPFAKFV